MIGEWLEAHRAGREMIIPAVEELEVGSRLREIVEPQGIKSLITIPMLHHSQLIGFIGFDSVRQHHCYTEKEKKLLWLYSEMLVNIHEREKAIANIVYERERAESANRAKSQFLANMSHEIRTPLNGIIGFTELLQDTQLDEQQQEFVKTINQASNLLYGIVNDILDFSKIEAGKLELVSDSTSLVQIIQHLSNLFTPKARNRGVDLQFDLQLDGHELIETDELRFTQVLVNLINNAIKFTYTGLVRVAIKCIGVHRRFVDFSIVIEDTGIGMDEELIHRLFRPFEQADSSTARVFGGTGLGLAISQRIVNAMGGKIMVESAPGVGSKFFFNLSFKRVLSANVLNSQASINETSVPSLRGKRILIAEDVRLNRELLGHWLTRTQCEIVYAENGQEAVDCALEQDFDLILMDLQMPLLDGFDASKRITANRPDIPIFALSAAISELDMARSKECGMRRHLPKPISRSDFYAAIAEELFKKRQK
ncbi:GAF domain-containing hybrid sensor histidine kinase/response regulator, partial [Aliidiomarina sanyensis]|uniref:histidine kinase n=1 Tax=Aliidiomarina sanyensis TaxID=1249555 RepID=A0A432W506_9GAMM